MSENAWMKEGFALLKLLYIDACPRPEGISRTRRLADAFLAGISGRSDAIETTRYALEDMRLLPVGEKLLALREALIDERRWDHPIFGPARDFAAADLIVVAAPYWDLMFPAMLKVYIEHIFIRELTFCYREDRPIGLCRARQAVYLTTAGSPIGDADFGTEYLRATFRMLGIPHFTSITAEGLDLFGADVAAILREAEGRAAALAATL